MCGIFAYVQFKGGQGACKSCGCTCSKTGNTTSLEFKRLELLEYGSKLRHRGPDWTGTFIQSDNKVSILMLHERLSIVDPLGGSQPLIHETAAGHKLVLCVNGEIFNHNLLRQEIPEFPYLTRSDCEVILALYLKYRDTNVNLVLEKLDGQFAFVLYDSEREKILIGRDPIGIASLYYSRNHKDDTFIIASEMKAIPGEFTVVEQFPPGCYLEITNDAEIEVKKVDYYSNSSEGAWKKRYFNDINPVVTNLEKSLDEEVVYKNIRDILTRAVKKRLMTDVPFGMLLSGGLDSSLVCSIATKILRSHEVDIAWKDNIHTYAVGLEGSPDMAKAQEVADFLGTYHFSFKFTLQEGLDAIRDVIYHLETYDITTIRASTPMYLLSRRVKSTGVKMVLSGEGSDEILGGYLYFLCAPDDYEFNKECHRRTAGLNKFDCLRADKSTMAWGVEGRYPFLDKEFIEYAIDLDPKLKRKNNIEKYVLRKAFDLVDETTGKPHFLPSNILWRQKEQFSDGVGYSWIDTLISTASSKYTDEEFKSLVSKYTVNPPISKEALMYREIFETLYPNRANTVDYWIPNTQWANVGSDPSGRAQKVHEKSYSVDPKS
jgi:asparagine synthase (glutamine-hydrolysing)